MVRIHCFNEVMVAYLLHAVKVRVANKFNSFFLICCVFAFMCIIKCVAFVCMHVYSLYTFSYVNSYMYVNIEN